MNNMNINDIKIIKYDNNHPRPGVLNFPDRIK